MTTLLYFIATYSTLFCYLQLYETLYLDSRSGNISLDETISHL